jgi:CBS domain-containing protein
MAAYNLIPGIPLDGGAIFKSLVWAITRSERRGTSAAADSGFACAGVLAVLPLIIASARGTSLDLVSLLLSLAVAVFVAMGASSALRAERLQGRMGNFTVAQFTRRAIPVPGDTPLAEALRRQGIAQAGALVIVSRDSAPAAIAQDAAISAVPVDRRPWVPVSSVSRELPPQATLTISMKGSDMLSAMQRAGASEYLVVDDDGLVVGVLVAADVAAAIRG